METNRIHDIIKEQQGGFVNFVRSQFQVAISNPDQFAAARKLILAQHNMCLRELSQKIAKCVG